MGVATAAIVAAGVAAGATAYAAKSSASSAKEANKTNLGRAAQQRALEERLFHEGRGSAGHAILPEYLGDFESQLGKDAIAGYKANLNFQGTPEEQLARYEEDAARFRPAFEQGNEVVDSIYSGAMERQQLEDAAPVMAARTGLAKTQRQGILDDITMRLGALEAKNFRKGYVGGSSAETGAALRATIPLRQQAAGVGALATLQNAQETQGIRDANRALRLNSLGLPAARARAATQFRQIPVAAAGEAAALSTAPFNFFRLPVGQQQASRLPEAVPVLSTGSIVGAGIGSAATSLGNYYANQALVKQANAMEPAPAYNPYRPGDYDYSPIPDGRGGYIYA